MSVIDSLQEVNCLKKVLTTRSLSYVSWRKLEFGVIGESLIKDRLICGVQDVKLKERLLREI